MNVSSYAAGTTVRGFYRYQLGPIRSERRCKLQIASISTVLAPRKSEARAATSRRGTIPPKSDAGWPKRGILVPHEFFVSGSMVPSLLRSLNNRDDLLTSVGTLLFPMEHAMRFGVEFAHQLGQAPAQAPQNWPSLTASLQFPLDPKEETWRPTSQRAAFGLKRQWRYNRLSTSV